MAAAEQLDTSVEYEIRYFEQGKMHSMIVVAENKKVAHQYYLECGKHKMKKPPLMAVFSFLIL
ncbi:RNA helicase [Vibrio parahaemolyticus]|uniref:RNA helicase n=1 Tax=Vibrio parahaemolyticus TaxID=670 RepID=UPI000B7779C8|nr:RNA helicase [Vibrio parahaemolyticus]OXD11422.1 RNA helicase [Vibrio parahaemolyticus]